MKKCPACENDNEKTLVYASRTNKTACLDCGHRFVELEEVLSRAQTNELKTQLYIQKALNRIKTMKNEIKAMEENLARLSK